MRMSDTVGFCVATAASWDVLARCECGNEFGVRWRLLLPGACVSLGDMNLSSRTRSPPEEEELFRDALSAFTVRYRLLLVGRLALASSSEVGGLSLLLI